MLVDRDAKEATADECCEKIIQLEAQIAALQADSAQPTGSQLWLQPEGSEGEKGDKGKSKKEKSRSGWIPKIAPLLAAYWDEDWTRAKSLAAGLYNGSEMLATLVDQQTRSGKTSHRRTS
jgi:hypothetical protein